MLLGTAMVAAVAAGLHPNLRLPRRWPWRSPARPDARTRPGVPAYDRRYRAFLLMHEHRRALDELLGARVIARRAEPLPTRKRNRPMTKSI